MRFEYEVRGSNTKDLVEAAKPIAEKAFGGESYELEFGLATPEIMSDGGEVIRWVMDVSAISRQENTMTDEQCPYPPPYADCTHEPDYVLLDLQEENRWLKSELELADIEIRNLRRRLWPH